MNVLGSLAAQGRAATLVVVLALAAALLTAVATIFVRQGLRGSDPYTAAWINMIVGAVGLWICVFVTGGVGEVSSRSLLLFAAAGLIGTIGGRLTRFLAIAQVGVHPVFFLHIIGRFLRDRPDQSSIVAIVRLP